MADVEPLSTAEGAKLVDFARACKAAARAVVLYPEGHPAIAATLARIVELTSTAALPAPMRITVHPDALLLADRPLSRVDPAVGELAVLLHSHLIGQLIVRPGGDAEAWRSFLLLLARTPESVRTDGGIARVWTTMAGRHIEVREIDYAEVLRERAGGEAAVWSTVVANCLQGMAFDLDEEAIKELLAIAADSNRLAELMAAVEAAANATGSGIAAKSAALLRMLRGILDAVDNKDPEGIEPVLHNMATAVGQLSPEMIVGLMEQREIEHGPQLMSAVVSRMSDPTIAQFVARNVAAEATATDRLAFAFQSLVPDEEQRPRLIALAKDDLASSPIGNTEGFESVWNGVAEKLLTSYSDKDYVSDTYARELSGARSQAVQVEQVHDDPPERISAWLGTVATTELRALDLTLLLDLLRIEQNDKQWGALMLPVVRLIEDLLLVGDFDAAARLVAVIVEQANSGATPGRRQQALVAIDVLIQGPMMRHITTHLATVDEAQFERVKTMCVSLGEVLVRPLAETLSVEERPRTRERLTSILLAFGAAGRRTVERLKGSPNPAVRRTAILLMRQFGGSEALPDLTELVDDNEPQVQREAVRAILNIATDDAYRILEEALAGGTERTREAIMQTLTVQRDDRATPLFAYIIRHVDHRGPLRSVYVRAIESLGALRDPDGIEPLKEALHKGEWWAPRRTAMLRGAAAAALARIGTPDAVGALEEAVAGGTRGVRHAARAHLATARSRRSPMGTEP
ncbi:MAG TPA: HEAT repeat domain-containing protein [Vicinamibacterales bacterium]|nr:HEAT repeat domain-containing protein [Vicinamibacterales bacterium]